MTVIACVLMPIVGVPLLAQVWSYRRNPTERRLDRVMRIERTR